MKLNIKRKLPWLAVLLWMAVIFLFSAQTGGLSGETSGSITRWLVEHIYIGFNNLAADKQEAIMAVVHTIVRKGAHFTEFAILAALVSNAIRAYNPKALLKWLIPIGFSALYAVTDELHQYFVPERACRLFDVAIDTAGAIFGTAIFILILFIITKAKNKKKPNN